MNTKTAAKNEKLATSKLVINKTTLKNLGIRSGVRTGRGGSGNSAPPTNETCDLSESCF